tara:strand:- start:50 stop:1474 length:1425 start_codon:yes stop_codon:yes gene_type:complete
MALINPNRVKETTETTGTGTYTLEGATGNFQGFTAVGDGNTCYYCCTDGTQFEIGIGTFTASGTTLARTTILSSTNSNNAISWSSGEKDIFVTLPSSKVLFEDANNNVAVGNNITVGGTVDGRDLATDGTKLDGIEASADVTDATNVTAAGALMDSEVTNLTQVKAFDSSDYATAAQGSTADAALPKAGGQMTGNITMSGSETVDGRDLSVDGTKLDGIEASATADQTDAEIKTAYENNSDTNAFTDALLTKLNGIETSATADQTKSDIDALNINADQVDGIEGSSFLRSDTGDNADGDITFNGGAGAITLTAGSDIRGNHGTWTGEANKIQWHSNHLYMATVSNHYFRSSGGSTRLTVDSSGNLTASGNVTAYSDERLKKDIVTIDNSIDKIKAMRGVYYKEIETDRLRTGVIAQEVEKVLPEVVMDVEETNPETGETTSTKSVDYGNMVGLLIEAIKEQQREIDELKAKVEG